MPDAEISLEDDEVIARVFFRYPNEREMFGQLRSTDFARNMRKHSGISLLRMKYLTTQQAIDWVPSNKLKGLAICKVRQLRQYGLQFMAPGTHHSHVSARCRPCNLLVDYPAVCNASDGRVCDFDIEQAPTLSVSLCAEFRVDTPVKLKLE
jgi:hypothetical protein